MEERLNIWYYKYLCRAGRLILIKVFPEATLVYWMSLLYINLSNILIKIIILIILIKIIILILLIINRYN